MVNKKAKISEIQIKKNENKNHKLNDDISIAQ